MRSACRTAIRLLATTFVAAVFVHVPDVAAGSRDCALPRSLPPLVPGEEVRFPGGAFVVDAVLAPGGELPRLELDLYARAVDPDTRRSRPGSYLPWLDVRYAFSTADAKEGRGRLLFRRARRGPSYGTSLAFDPRATPPLELRLTIDRREGATDDSCPRLPLVLELAIDPSRLPRTEARGEIAKAAADDQRLDLRGSLNPRPDDGGYSDLWGWDDGTTFLAIVGTRNGTLFIDTTNPAQPVEVAFIPGPFSIWRDMKVYQDHAYIVTEGFGAGEGMQIVSLADPAAPELVNIYTDTFITAHNIFIDEPQGRVWVFGTNNATRVLDLTADPVHPVDLGSFTRRYVHDGYVRGDTAYFSESQSGLQEIVDVSDPGAMQVLSSFVTPLGATHNCWPNADETVLAVTDETDGGHVTLWDITDKNGPNPQLGAYVPDPESIVHNVKYDDDPPNRLLISHYRLATKYVDAHRPSFPVELGSYDSYPGGDTGSGGVWGIYAYDARGYLYASDINVGLLVFDYVPTGGTLSGVVRDADDGRALRGAEVLHLATGSRVATRDDGVYAFYVEQGDVALRVSAPGYRTRIVQAGAMPLDGRVDLDVDLEPHERVALTGVVRRVGDLAPVPGATLRIVGLPDAEESGADGRYAFPSVAVGQRILLADAPGYAPHDQRVWLGLDTPTATLDLVLSPARFFDDAEADRGWTFGDPDDTAFEGFWTRVDPNGTVGGKVQPEDDHTPHPGITAFVTGQSSVGASAETNDVDGGVTTLVSPRIDASGLGAVKLSFARWISSTYGNLDGGSLRLEASADDGETWTTVDLQGTGSGGWQPAGFALDAFVPPTAELRLRFRAEAIASFPTSRVLECAVDDLEVFADCRARFSPSRSDLDGDGVVDVCDPCERDGLDDVDADGVCGDVDNAPFAANPDQSDGDDDGVGDAGDNCAAEPNADQRDLDRDGVGDACDADVDGDGLPAGLDLDLDGDGVFNVVDTCPTVRDVRQGDWDGDGEGDLCDSDDGTVGGVRLGERYLVWEPEEGVDAYNVYRGHLGHPALLAASTCLASGLTATIHVDHELPEPGDGFLYVIAPVLGGVEGPPGHTSAGDPRIVNGACP